MEIKVETIYGNVTIKIIYNYDDSDRIISYSAYDDNGKYLGDLSCVHEIYEVDDKTLGLLAELVVGVGGIDTTSLHSPRSEHRRAGEGKQKG